MKDQLFFVFPNERYMDLGLYQSGWEKCTPLHSYGPYIRNHYLFHYIISGAGTLVVEDSDGNTTNYRVRGGEGFMIFPKQITTYFADKNTPWEYVWAEFDGLKVREALDCAGISENTPIYRPQAKEKAIELKNEMMHIARHSEESHLHLIGHLYLFLDCLTKSSAARKIRREEKIGDFYIREAISFVEQNFQSEISVEDMANFCNLNRSYFGKLFKEKVGKSPQEFLISYRMNKAAELLKLTELSIGDISKAVGYPSQLHFSRAFKNLFGSSPRQWRSDNKL